MPKIYTFFFFFFVFFFPPPFFPGKLAIGLAEIELRCAADDACAGFSQDTKDGAPYFRPQQKITAIGADPKWTTLNFYCIYTVLSA